MHETTATEGPQVGASATDNGDPLATGDRGRLLTLPVVSWAFYDFANTIFSFAVITRYFNEWVIDEHGRPDWQVGMMGLAVGLVLVVVMPALGAVSDIVGRRKPFLAVCTAACVVATAALGFVDSVTTALVVAGIAIFAYQLALSMYDPLLATVAPPGRAGAVSGLGVGLGYVGVLVGSLLLTALVPEHHQQEAFLPTAILFAVFALPLFRFVHERGSTSADPGTTAVAPPLGAIVRRALVQVVATVTTIRAEHRDTGRFLLARFLYADAITTVIAFMTVYMSRVGEFSKADKTFVLALAMVAAAAGAFVAGSLVERVGPKRVLVGILMLGATSLVVAAVTGSASLVWVLGPAVGITLGGVWTSDRVLMLRLAPPELRGEMFGIYNLVGKLSSGIGPIVLWGGTIWVLHDHGPATLLGASRVALVMLAIAIVGGLLLLRPLRDHDRYPDDRDVQGAPIERGTEEAS